MNGSSPTPCSTSSPRPLPCIACATCSSERAFFPRGTSTSSGSSPGSARSSPAAPRSTPLSCALAFLSWLDDRGTTLGAAIQADVDDWLHGATRYRYLLRDFLTWAGARRLAGNVTVPALPPSELSGLISEDSRWELLSRCLRDQGIPLDVRTAGALLLLYGQFVSRLTRLTDADTEQHGPDTCLRLDTVPVLLPSRLAALVRAQLDAAPRTPATRAPARCSPAGRICPSRPASPSSASEPRAPAGRWQVAAPACLTAP